MTRQIQREPSAPQPPDRYMDRLLKLVPAEVAAAFTAIHVFLLDKDDFARDWIILLTVIVVLSALTPVYMIRILNIYDISQIVVSTISFVVWAGNISIVVWMLIIPTFRPEVIFPIVLILWVFASPMLTYVDERREDVA